VTPEKAQAWAEGVVTEGRTAHTVRGVWLTAAKSVFKWAVDTRRLPENPFEEVRIAKPRKIITREKAFRPEEVSLILNASLSAKDAKSFGALRRWVPWLCAYTGARAGEITQLRCEDVKEREGHWVIEINPEAGAVKTGQQRVVPLHAHLIEQGFLDFVCRRGEGPLFHNASVSPKTNDPTSPARPPAVLARMNLAAWVRKLGVTDKGVAPNHGWRHLFKRKADRAGISEKISDAITGHAQASVGRGYGAPTIEDLAHAIGKFPRYDLKD
jgi:integrase